MLQLENKTPFAANLTVLPDELGVDTAYLMVRASFVLTEDMRWSLTSEQHAPTEADQYAGEPGLSSLLIPSEYNLGKTSSDIIVIGDACSPEGRPVRALDASVRVGHVNKTVRVFGDRIWQNGHISQPEYFDRMPITYERAYGGVCSDENSQVISTEERNPAGLGFLGKYHSSQFENTLLPNIEDPNQLIQSLKDRPDPAGFGAIAPNWSPRVAYAGTYDEHWQASRAPFLPLDFDKRFFNCATPELIYPGFIQGGEAVQVSNMNIRGELNFNLPIVNLQARALISKHYEQLTMLCETVLLQPNQMEVSMCWKGKVAVGKKLSKVAGMQLWVGQS